MVKVVSIKEGSTEVNGTTLKFQVVKFQSDEVVINKGVMDKPKASMLLTEAMIGTFKKDQELHDYKVVKDEDHEWETPEGETIKGRWVLARV